MRMPLVWLNVMLATILALIYSQPEFFLPPKEVDLVLIAGGPEGSEAYDQALACAESFERDWRRPVSVVPSETGAPERAHALKIALSLQPKGISMPGSTNPELLLPFVTEAQRRGTRVTFHSSPLPEAEERFRYRGTGYVGNNSTLDGEYAARSAIRRLALPPGARVLVVGTAESPEAGTRIRGCINAIAAHGCNDEYLKVIPFDDSDLEEATAPDPALVRRITEGAKPDLILWDAGLVNQLTGILDDTGYDPSEIHVVTFVPALGLPLGEQFFIKQQFFEQAFLAGYMSLVQLDLAERHLVKGLHIPLHASP